MIYQFFCDNCNKMHEAWQHMNAEHKLDCPDCGIPARRIYNSTPFKFTFFHGWDHGLGAYCDTKKDKARIMEAKNLIEQ